MSLERLLRAGDAPERVWAAWSLALREAADLLPRIIPAATQTPDAAVRASLVVILAGHGRRDVLAALAGEDPDADVRAAACRHLAGTSLPDMTWAREFLEERLAIDDAPEVLRVLVDLAVDSRISLTEERRARLLAHPDERVRLGAAEHAIADWRVEGPMPAGLQTLLGDEDQSLRERVADLVADRLGVGGLAHLMAMDPTSGIVVARQLERLAERGVRAGWNDLRSLAYMEGAEAGIVAVLAAGEVAARPWLFDVAIRQECDAWPAAMASAIRLASLAPPLGPDELPAAAQVYETLREWIALWDEDSDLVDAWPAVSGEWIDSQRVGLAALAVALRRGGHLAQGPTPALVSGSWSGGVRGMSLPLSIETLIEVAGREAFDDAAARASTIRRHAFTSSVPHELADRLWYEGDEPLVRRLAVAVELVERMPCYGNFMYWRHRYTEFDVPTREAMWNAYRRFLEAKSLSLVDAACYSLWVDWFEDPEAVEAAWSALTDPLEPMRPRLDRLLPHTGPVPWHLKAPLFRRLASLGGWDDVLVQALTFSAGDVFGQIDVAEAAVLLADLTPAVETRRHSILQSALAGGRDNLRERLIAEDRRFPPPWIPGGPSAR